MVFWSLRTPFLNRFRRNDSLLLKKMSDAQLNVQTWQTCFFPDTDTFLGFWTLPMIAKLFASQENSDIETAVLHTGRHVDPSANGGQFEAVQYHHVKQKWTRDKLH